MPVVQDRFAIARAKVLAEIAALDAAAEQQAERKAAEAKQAASRPAPVSSPVTVADFEADFDRSPAPPSPGLPPVTASTSAPTPPTTVRPPKLPAPMLQQLEARAAELADAGRAITAADVQAVINLPAAMAEQAAKYYAAANAPA
jgi:hypothetical protein